MIEKSYKNIKAFYIPSAENHIRLIINYGLKDKNSYLINRSILKNNDFYSFLNKDITCYFINSNKIDDLLKILDKPKFIKEDLKINDPYEISHLKTLENLNIKLYDYNLSDIDESYDKYYQKDNMYFIIFGRQKLDDQKITLKKKEAKSDNLILKKEETIKANINLIEKAYKINIKSFNKEEIINYLKIFCYINKSDLIIDGENAIIDLFNHDLKRIINKEEFIKGKDKLIKLRGSNNIEDIASNIIFDMTNYQKISNYNLDNLNYDEFIKIITSLDFNNYTITKNLKK